MPTLDLGKVTLTDGEQAVLNKFSVNENGEVESSAPVIETISGYTFVEGSDDPTYGDGVTDLFAGVVRNGNKITFVISGELEKPAGAQTTSQLGHFTMPSDIYNALVADRLSSVDSKLLYLAKNRSSVGESLPVAAIKGGSNTIYIYCYGTNNLDANEHYVFRYEVTFLLCDNMVE